MIPADKPADTQVVAITDKDKDSAKDNEEEAYQSVSYCGALFSIIVLSVQGSAVLCERSRTSDISWSEMKSDVIGSFIYYDAVLFS